MELKGYNTNIEKFTQEFDMQVSGYLPLLPQEFNVWTIPYQHQLYLNIETKMLAEYNKLPKWKKFLLKFTEQDETFPSNIKIPHGYWRMNSNNNNKFRTLETAEFAKLYEQWLLTKLEDIRL